MSRPDYTGHDLGTDPLAVTVTKRPMQVHVAWAREAGLLPTREGRVHFAEGDALLDDGAGYRWPVAPQWLHVAYQPLPPTRAGENGAYVARPVEARARRIDTPFSVRVGMRGDSLHGERGDWLMQYANGAYGIVAAAIFDRSYDASS